MSDDGGFIRVGDKFSSRSEWEDNTLEFRYTNGSLMLQYNLKNPSGEDIRAFGQGAISFGLFKKGSNLMLCFKIDGFCDWSDQGFSMHLVHEEDREVVDPKGMHTPLTLVLVDSDTGVVKKLRVSTMSKHMSDVFYRELKTQLKMSFDIDKYNKAIDEINFEHQSSKALAGMCFIMERLGCK